MAYIDAIFSPNRPVMVWHYASPPPFAWDGDAWIRNKDDKRFVANHRLEAWVSPKEKIYYHGKTKKMGEW